MESVLVRVVSRNAVVLVGGRVGRCDASGTGISAAGDGASSMWCRRRFIVAGCVHVQAL